MQGFKEIATTKSEDEKFLGELFGDEEEEEQQ